MVIEWYIPFRLERPSPSLTWSPLKGRHVRALAPSECSIPDHRFRPAGPTCL